MRRELGWGFHGGELALDPDSLLCEGEALVTVAVVDDPEGEGEEDMEVEVALTGRGEPCIMAKLDFPAA